jgi:hypothetical protein
VTPATPSSHGVQPNVSTETAVPPLPLADIAENHFGTPVRRPEIMRPRSEGKSTNFGIASSYFSISAAYFCTIEPLLSAALVSAPVGNAQSFDAEVAPRICAQRPTREVPCRSEFQNDQGAWWHLYACRKAVTNTDLHISPVVQMKFDAASCLGIQRRSRHLNVS